MATPDPHRKTARHRNVPASQAPAEQAPAAPAEQAPAEQAPAEQAPAGHAEAAAPAAQNPSLPDLPPITLADPSQTAVTLPMAAPEAGSASASAADHTIALTSATAGGMPATIGGYTLEQLLGQGGMGVVYRAVNDSGQVAALKVLQPGSLGDEAATQRFLREVSAAQRIAHPHVLQLLAGGQDGPYCFMATELLEGGDLDQACKRRGVFTEAKALSVIADCAAGLQAIADAGLIHRDIKPNNIFLRRDGTPVIGDLGLARQADGDDRMTMTGMAMGTPAYMSPEHVRGESDVDIRTDIYALGAMLFRMVTGSEPYAGETIYAITDQVLHSPVPDPRRLNGSLSAGICAIIYHCLAKERSQRYARPADLAQDIDRLQHGQPLVHAAGVDLTKRNPLRAAGSQDLASQAILPLSPAERVTTSRRQHGGSAGLAWWSNLSTTGRRLITLSICAVILMSGFSWLMKGMTIPSGTTGITAMDPMRPSWASEFQQVGHSWIATLTLGQHHMTFSWCAPGSFIMGSPSTEVGHSEDEGQRQITIDRGFWISQQEISGHTWQALTTIVGQDQLGIELSAELRAGQDQQLPMRQIDWYQADAWARSLGTYVGAQVRLPSEAEWEYAARAGSQDAYAGLQPEQAGLMAQGEILTWWSDAERSGLGFAYVADKAQAIPVGVRAVSAGHSNAWGLLNMVGNVAEWCRDDLSVAQGNSRILRGGSWLELPHRCRVAARAIVDATTADRTTGFRVVITP